MLGADAFVTKPLSPGFFRYLWQYDLLRDPEWYAGVDLDPPPAPPPPPPGGLRHDAALSVMSADAFASDSARLAELSLKGAPPYAVGAMRLEPTPVPLPAPAGTVDPKRQWGGAPDGAAPGEPFVDADGAQ